MKAILSKIPAMIGMLFTLMSFFYYVNYFFDTIPDSWTVSVIIAMFSMLFYFIDAIISLVKAIKKNDPKFNCLLALVLFGGIPMVVIFGGDGKDLFNVIWNVYYLLMLVLEVISIKKAIAAAKANRRQLKEDAAC